MRLAWRSAKNTNTYDVFLLINDDVVLNKNFWDDFIATDNYCIKKYNRSGIYSAATLDPKLNTVSYRGEKITSRLFRVKSRRISPSGTPQSVDMVNANILWVDKSVVFDMGFLSEHFQHGLSDYDYGLRANKHNIPILICGEYGGVCFNDHKKII